MILDVFSELQKAKPWGPEPEQSVLLEAVEQAKLADALGYGCWWTVEHHGAVEFSYSSAPEIVVAVLAQHTRRLRFGPEYRVSASAALRAEIDQLLGPAAIAA